MALTSPSHSTLNFLIVRAWTTCHKVILLRSVHEKLVQRSFQKVYEKMYMSTSGNAMLLFIFIYLFSVCYSWISCFPYFSYSGTHLSCGSSLQQPCVSSSPVPGYSFHCYILQFLSKQFSLQNLKSRCCSSFVQEIKTWNCCF